MGKLNPSKWVKRSLSLLCTMTLGLSLMGSPLVVYADDYNYIPINDWTLYNAYKFFHRYNWNLDYQHTVSYDVDLDGTYQWTGTLNSTTLGSEAGSINVTVTGTSTSLDGQGGSLSSFNTLFSLNGLVIDIDPVLNSGNVTGTQLACTFSNPNTTIDQYTNMSCTNNSVYQMPTFDATIRDLTGAEAVSMSQLYLTLASREDGGGTYDGQITLNESGTNSGSGTLDLDGTISTNSHKVYDIPILVNNTNINNNYNIEKRIFFKQDDPFVISYLSDATTYPNNLFDVYSISDTEGNTPISVTKKRYGFYSGGYNLWSLVIQHTDFSSGYYIRIANNTALKNGVIPLYVGFLNNMPDDLYRYCIGTDRTRDLMENGSAASQAVESTANSTNNAFNISAQQYENIENSFSQNMNTSLSNTSTTSSMFSNSKFLSTANWVKVQFERIVINTPFELLIVYCLILGIALVLIGKVR